MSAIRSVVTQTLRQIDEVQPGDGFDEVRLKWLAAHATTEDVRDPRFHDWCAGVAREFVRRGLPVPSPLDSFVVGVLDGTLERKRRGPRVYVNNQRNAVIFSALVFAVSAGLSPTQNEATPGATSACGLVADCLADLGHDLGYKAVEKIWTSWSGALLNPTD